MTLDNINHDKLTIVVTGAAGMIGSHLCDKFLQDGHSVIGVDDLTYGKIENLRNAEKIDNFQFIFQDISESLGVLHHISVDLICHLASVKKAPDAFFSFSSILLKNHHMLNNIIDYAFLKKVPVLYTSTSDVYGQSEYFSETSELNIGPTDVGRYTYAISKIHDERLLLAYSQELKLNCVILRLFGCFSERSSTTWSGGHIPIFINNALLNEDLVIYGDGSQTRSMCHISRLIDYIAKAAYNARKLNGQIINLGSTQEMSVLDSAKLIIDICQSKSDIKFKHQCEVYGNYKEIQRRFANIDKAKQLLEFDPNFDLTADIMDVTSKWKHK